MAPHHHQVEHLPKEANLQSLQVTDMWVANYTCHFVNN